ncbi:hypothetical protein TorRG33x02_321240 [Trema orientale]|uniref:Uncharacterized protein n=1 Tax=Trema orientale TaxID=63057 RepID=A0A2P5BH78_TREOI|nr:hypothetical protein TorRG33x02_321240 [Trema orientale]
MVDNVLWPIDVKVVKTIPLSIQDREDSIIWHYEENGFYTVRSGNSFGSLIALLRCESSSGELFTRPYHLSLISSVARSPSTPETRYYMEGLPRISLWWFLSQILLLISKAVKIVFTKMRVNAQESTIRWLPPPLNTIKMNSDAAVHPSGGGIGIAVIFRDHTGSVIATLSKKLNGLFNVEIAELLAMAVR